MSQPVTIENDAIRMEVWPAIGGKVASVVDKADKYELMFTYPNEVPTAPRYDAPFDDSWCGGWDECFPAVAPGRYVGHPYDGIPVPDHGELWGLPTTAVPTKDGITTVWHGLRFGYRLTRKLYLSGNSLVAEYTLINLAPFEFRYVWSLHSLMSLHVPAELDLVKPTDFRYSHDGEGVDHQKPFTWPTMEDGDLSKPAHLPARKGWKVFSMSPIDTPMVVRYPSRGRSLSIEYSAEDGPTAYWGVWMNTGGWSGYKHFAIEPTTGRFDQIDRSVRDSSAGSVAGLGRAEWTVRWTLGSTAG
jgi:hypothetical protein